MTTTQITITETEAPSRSKGQGMAWIDQPGGGIFASRGGRTHLADVGATLTIKAKADIRRATRREVVRDEVDVLVTGNPDDTVEITVGRPQPYTAVVAGVRAV